MAKNIRRDIRTLLSFAVHDLQAQVNTRLAKKGYPVLRPAQAHVLAFVDATGLRLSELITRCGLAKQTVGDVVDELERLKMVERFADPNHGVIKRVRLGQKGRAWAADMRKVADAVEAQWETLLGKTKVRELRRLLEDLTAALATESES